MAARQAQAEKAMATAKQVQAEQEALRKKCEDFVQRTVVPADPPESCGQEGVRRNAKCEKMVGKLDMEFGRYEITVEQASRIGPSCTLTEEKRKAVSHGEPLFHLRGVEPYREGQPELFRRAEGEVSRFLRVDRDRLETARVTAFPERLQVRKLAEAGRAP